MGRNITIVALVAVALAATVFGVLTWKKASALEREIAAVRAEAETLRKSLAEMETAHERSVAEIEDLRATASASAAAVAADVTGSEGMAAGAASSKKGGNPMAGLLQGMRDNPELKEMLAGQQKMMVDRMYGPLLENLDLTSDEKEELRALLVERQISSMDQGLLLMDGAISKEEKAALTAELGKEHMEWKKKIEEMVGDENYEKMDLYEKSQQERQQIKTFKDSLSGSGHELTFEQEEALMSAMYEERKNFKFTKNMYEQEDVGADASTNTIDERVKLFSEESKQLQEQTYNRVAEILSPEQLESFRRSQENFQSMQKFGMKMGLQMMGGDGPKEE